MVHQSFLITSRIFHNILSKNSIIQLLLNKWRRLYLKNIFHKTNHHGDQNIKYGTTYFIANLFLHCYGNNLYRLYLFLFFIMAYSASPAFLNTVDLFSVLEARVLFFPSNRIALNVNNN